MNLTVSAKNKCFNWQLNLQGVREELTVWNTVTLHWIHVTENFWINFGNISCESIAGKQITYLNEVHFSFVMISTEWRLSESASLLALSEINVLLMVNYYARKNVSKDEHSQHAMTFINHTKGMWGILRNYILNNI